MSSLKFRPLGSWPTYWCTYERRNEIRNKHNCPSHPLNELSEPSHSLSIQFRHLPLLGPISPERWHTLTVCCSSAKWTAHSRRQCWSVGRRSCTHWRPNSPDSCEPIAVYRRLPFHRRWSCTSNKCPRCLWWSWQSRAQWTDAGMLSIWAQYLARWHWTSEERAVKRTHSIHCAVQLKWIRTTWMCHGWVSVFPVCRLRCSTNGALYEDCPSFLWCADRSYGCPTCAEPLFWASKNQIKNSE